MKAVIITEPGGPEVLEVRDVEMPQIGELEVLVEVKAAGVNRPCLLYTSPSPRD